MLERIGRQLAQVSFSFSGICICLLLSHQHLLCCLDLLLAVTPIIFLSIVTWLIAGLMPCR